MSSAVFFFFFFFFNDTATTEIYTLSLHDALPIGHLPPPLVDGELSGAARDLERLVDEYAQADGLDQRRRQRLAGLIVETARRNGLAGEAGIDSMTEPN